MVFGQSHRGLGAGRLALSVVVFLSLLAVTVPSYAWDLSLDAQAQGLAHYIMAVCHDLNGESALAINEYQESVKLNGLEPAPRLKLGAYYLRLNDIKAAQEELTAVIRLAPQDTQAHYLLALLYSSEHKYDLAASEYEIILKMAAKDDPHNLDAHLYLGQLYYAQAKYPQAIEAFVKILQFDPVNTSALFLLGSLYADTHEPMKAMGLFHQLLQLEPENSEALNSLGYMYADQGVHLDEAVRMIEKAIAIDPANGAYYDSLGWALYKKGRYTESLTALEKAASTIDDEVLYDHLGDVYQALKQYTQACHYWHKSLTLDPHQISVQEKIKKLCIASR